MGGTSLEGNKKDQPKETKRTGLLQSISLKRRTTPAKIAEYLGITRRASGPCYKKGGKVLSNGEARRGGRAKNIDRQEWGRKNGAFRQNDRGVTQ